MDEVNTGPVTKKTNLSFAVWNLIESFQAIYEFDIFGGGGGRIPLE